MAAALTGGEVRFSPGLFAAAHVGVLYVDEVTLLPGHLVDVLIDVAVPWRRVPSSYSSTGTRSQAPSRPAEANDRHINDTMHSHAAQAQRSTRCLDGNGRGGVGGRARLIPSHDRRRCH